MKSDRRFTFNQAIKTFRDEMHLGNVKATRALYRFKFPDKTNREIQHLARKDEDRLGGILYPKKNGSKYALSSEECQPLFDMLCDYLYENNRTYREAVITENIKPLALDKFGKYKCFHDSVIPVNYSMYFEKVCGCIGEFAKIEDSNTQCYLHIEPVHWHDYIGKVKLTFSYDISYQNENSVSNFVLHGLFHQERSMLKITFWDNYNNIAIDGKLQARSEKTLVDNIKRHPTNAHGLVDVIALSKETISLKMRICEKPEPNLKAKDNDGRQEVQPTP